MTKDIGKIAYALGYVDSAVKGALEDLKRIETIDERTMRLIVKRLERASRELDEVILVS